MEHRREGAREGWVRAQAPRQGRGGRERARKGAERVRGRRAEAGTLERWGGMVDPMEVDTSQGASEERKEEGNGDSYGGWTDSQRRGASL